MVVLPNPNKQNIVADLMSQPVQIHPRTGSSHKMWVRRSRAKILVMFQKNHAEYLYEELLCGKIQKVTEKWLSEPDTEQKI